MDHQSNSPPSVGERIKRWVIGRPRDLRDKSLFRHISLVAILAWVGLGADGLSSSCYGPAEAFMVFRREQWYHRLLHNETACAVQRRLQWEGIPLVILPTRVA